MQVTHKSAQEFIPVEINLTFENINELAAFYAIFNCGKITNTLNIDGQALAIRSNINDAGGILNYSWDNPIFSEAFDALSAEFTNQ